MGEVINLNKIRKARAQAAAKAQASRNRAAFGRTKAETSKTLAEKLQADKRLDGHERED